MVIVMDGKTTNCTIYGPLKLLHKCNHKELAHYFNSCKWKVFPFMLLKYGGFDEIRQKHAVTGVSRRVRKVYIVLTDLCQMICGKTKNYEFQESYIHISLELNDQAMTKQFEAENPYRKTINTDACLPKVRLVRVHNSQVRFTVVISSKVF